MRLPRIIERDVENGQIYGIVAYTDDKDSKDDFQQKFTASTIIGVADQLLAKYYIVKAEDEAKF